MTTDIDVKAPHREIGAPRPRVEDRRLLMGTGRFTDDAAPEGAARAFVVRSPHAHARIRAIDTSRAASLPGVLAVLTGADAAADGMRPIPHDPDWTSPPDATLRLPDGFEVAVTPNLPLPVDTVRYCGEAVALVVAQSAAIAADAGELVEVDYEPLPAVTEARAAMTDGAPRLWPGCANNLALTCEVGEPEATDAAFAAAAHVVSLHSWVHRVTGAPLEPRAVIGEYDPAVGRYTVRTGSGRGAVQTRARPRGHPWRADQALPGHLWRHGRQLRHPERLFARIRPDPLGRPAYRPPRQVDRRPARMLSLRLPRPRPRLGGGAGPRRGRQLPRPQGREHPQSRGLRGLLLAARKGLSMAQGVYRIPAAHFRGHAVLTNTAPTAVYRSAGRPEVIYMIERLIDLAAEEHGFDRVTLRRRNLIDPEAMPYTNAVGVTYDSGDYPAAMETALDAADWSGFEARRADSERRGRYRGIAIANYIEVTSGIPRERAELRALPDGTVELAVGTMSSGQGHETSFAQLVSDWLGIPFERVRYVANDTDRVSVGGGSHSGRSMRLASIAIGQAVEALIERGRAVAALALQAAPESIIWREGAFHTEGGAGLPLAETAALAAENESLPAHLRSPVEGVGDITNEAGGFPYGSHVCEVEVDPETGEVRLVAWTGLDDVGLAVNPPILHGQSHGAIVQGVGQALLEAIRYSPEDGQLLTGSFMDYAMPRADTVPPFRTLIGEVPASSHPHGIRPGGGRRSHPRARPRRQRGLPCPREPRRSPHRDAADARTGLAGDRKARRNR